jgi:acyl-coenzyme A synthetase/AMP-(fatty) acid ligase
MTAVAPQRAVRARRRVYAAGIVKSKTASYKAPRSVRFVDSLPRTETGKLLKSELKAADTTAS